MNNQESNQKDGTKDKIVLFVIGVLVGAVISAGAFLLCVNTLGANHGGQPIPMQGNTPSEMPSGQSSLHGQGGPSQNSKNGPDSQKETNGSDEQNENNSKSPEKPNDKQNNSN